MTAAGGEIWRVTNASAGITYDLRLWNLAQKQDMIVQVLSIDAAGLPSQAMAQIIGNKVSPLPCPGVDAASAKSVVQPLCTTRLLMMPSTRAEIRVAYRDATGALTAPPPAAQAIFRTAGFVTGPDGDTWPAVDLGTVLFETPATKVKAAAALSMNGGVADLTVPRALASDWASANVAVGEDAMCKALPKNHKRRIFFNAPIDSPDAFGLGCEELDEHNIPVPGTFMDVKAFGPMRPTVCLPLGAGNTPVTERWELVNLAGEDHNFYMHQVRFRALSATELDQTSLPCQISGQGVLLDSVPLVHADGICASVGDWSKDACTAHPVTVDIPFAVAGDFVYHCHILEHEDGGMMARIRVRSKSGQAAGLH